MEFIHSLLDVLSQYGIIGLIIIAFSESSFFPIPPDLLLIPLSIGQPGLAIFYALVTTASSVAGAVFGWWIGKRFGRKVLRKIVSDGIIKKADEYFEKYGGQSLAIAGFSPIPYKVFTILSGISNVRLRDVILWSLLGRGTRFLLEGLVILVLGKSAESFISQYFTWITGLIVIVILLIAGIYKWIKRNKECTSGNRPFHTCTVRASDLNVYELLKYLFLGLIQGITEPIPVSSSGHFILFEHFFGLKITGLSFEVLVNFASLLAVLFIYRSDLIELTKNGVQYLFASQKTEEMKKDFYFIVYLVIGTIPAGIIGVLFQDQIAEFFKGVRVIGFTLILTGVALWLIRNLKGRKGDGELTFKDAIIIGLSQAVALIPGISRSGATIVSSMGLGLKRKTALKFSFFLYIPVSLGGMLLGVSDLIHDPDMGRLFLPYTVAFFASLIASYFSLKWFINIMKHGKLGYFSIYCFIVGVVVIMFG